MPRELRLNVEALAAADSLEAFTFRIHLYLLRKGIQGVAELYHLLPKPFFIEAGLDRGYLKELLDRLGPRLT